MIIAVDFDGTIVRHEFPGIGRELDGALATMHDLKKAGHEIVIWTCRCGETLAEMVEWFRENDFCPSAINSNAVPVVGFAVPKILANVYIDDRNFGGFPGWQAVRDAFLPGTSGEEEDLDEKSLS